MKQVLISTQPKWVNKILGGEKTIEVRKTRPTLETPFKCYIYETTAKYKTKLLGLNCTCQGKGKVIGEYICDGIQEYESEFWDDETFETIGKVSYDMETGEREVFHFVCNLEDNYVCQKSGLSWEELRQYVGQGIKTFYGWHITNVKIYDKPKELSEFYIYDEEKRRLSIDCEHKKPGYSHDWCLQMDGRFCNQCLCDKKRLTRPPQSWCYVYRS